MSIVTAAVLTAFGAGFGWWPLSAWARRAMFAPVGERMRARTVRVLCAASAGPSYGLLTWSFWPAAVLPALLTFCAVAVVLAVVDIAEHRLPNNVIVAGLLAVTALLVIAAVTTGEWLRLLWALGGAGGLFTGFLLLALISPSAMGMGDVKLAALIGLTLGWFGGWPVVLGVGASFVVGGIVAVVALSLRRVTLRGALPFGPSMLAGAILALLLSAG